MMSGLDGRNSGLNGQKSGLDGPVDDAAHRTPNGCRVGVMSNDPTYRPTITTQAELERLWATQVSPPADGEPRLWLLRIDAQRRPEPRILEIVGAVDPPPPDPDDETTAALVTFLRRLVEDEPGSSVAALRSRPGRGVRREDREWAHGLHAAAAAAGVPLEVVHLLTDAGVTPLPLDEIGLRTTA
jgi:hypothetical protein